MRFKEFKLYEAAGATQYVTVGDSHAAAIATAGGKGWINLAIPGRNAKSPDMLAKIKEVPAGSVVVVSLGANDTANAFRAAVEQKKKPRDPQSIANDVAAVISKVQAQNPAKVIFMLFPNGTGRTDKNKEAQWYGGDYQEAVRSAIKAAVGVPVIDINGAPLTDGVHAGMSTYRDVANKVRSNYKGEPVTSGQGAKPAPASTSGNTALDVVKQMQPDNPAIGEVEKLLTSVDVPDSRIGPDVADIQKVLVALGYPLPKHGVDGVRGTETTNAIKQFQQDFGLKVDGDPGPETVQQINSILHSNPKVAGKLTKSAPTDVKARTIDDGGKLEPVAYSAVTQGKIGKLLDLIAKPESGGHYDIMMGGKRVPAILKMSLNELLRFQKEYKAQGHETAAAGRYQFMPDTLRSVAKGLGLNFNSDTFNPKTQDDLAIYLLRTKGLDRWLAGKMSDEAFMDRLAQVWAGLPSPSKGGASWYQGVGSNKAGISVAAVQNTLNDIKSA